MREVVDFQHDVAIAVGKAAIGEQCQSLAAVATEIPSPSKSHRFQKEQGEQLAVQGRRLTVGKTQRPSSGEYLWGESRL